MENHRFSTRYRPVCLAGVTVAAVLATAGGVMAQALKDVGWDEYFVRKGHPVYVPDQVGRGRSGFNQSALAKVPMLVVFGDHRDTPTGLPTLPTWQARFEACQAMIGRLKNAGGQAEMLAPPDRGIRGNSHMIMQDRNNLPIADLILRWIGERVSKRSGGNR